MIVAGMDIGSITTETVILRDGEILTSVIISTGANSRKAAERALSAALEKAGLGREALAAVVTTGYPIAEDTLKKSDVMLIGYAGGGVRNIVGKKPVRNMAELKNFSIRVMGAPIQTRMFQAITAAPTVIAYDEVYNAIQTGVIMAGENESPGWSQMKWHEVAPEISLTQHAITIRPLCFSGKVFRKLPKDLQDAIIKAGKDGAAHGRKWERDADDKILEKMKAEGKIRIHPFTERAKLLELAAPVKTDFAKEIGAEKVLAAISAVK